MSKYELMNYDELLRRIGIEIDRDQKELWYCGGNPLDDVTYDEGTYDDIMTYTGKSPSVSGFCLTEDVNVNGLLLNHRDMNNTIWLCTGIDGWWTTPPAEISDVPKPFWDGSLLTTGRYTARTITVSGCFIPPDKSMVWYNRKALIQAITLVRGVGLLAMCGNETGTFNSNTVPNDDFLDPPKMAIIQTADQPLIDTNKGNGFTVFSLSFRCVFATKISVYEKHEFLPIEDTTGPDAVVRERYYRAFGTTVPPITTYDEVRNLMDPDRPTATRRYAEVEKVNLDSLIKDEEYSESMPDDVRQTFYQETGTEQVTVLHNSGNYFAFPIFVFDEITGASPTQPVTVYNTTTSETMQIIKPVPAGQQLVVDTGMRRVGVVEDAAYPPSWKWDDRNYLTLTSEWITLAPGDNTIVIQKVGKDEGGPGLGVNVPDLPRVFWRDTWIG